MYGGVGGEELRGSPLSRFVPNRSQPFQRKTVSDQRVMNFPASMTKRRQIFHGTKLAQSGTKILAKTPLCSHAKSHADWGIFTLCSAG
jgi:hypothetical protein